MHADLFSAGRKMCKERLMSSIRFQVRCLVTLAIILIVPCTDDSINAETQKIRISLSSRSNTNTSYYVAQARNFFKDEGLEVEFIQINPRLGAMALNGDVTFTTSFVSTFRGVVQGLPMKTVF